MACNPEKVISVAEGEVGYLEKKSNKDLDSKTKNAGSNNYTKYGAWYGDNPDYWCAMFICWIYHTAFGDTAAKKLLCGAFSAACETIRKNFVNAKQWYTSPKAGDLIFFTGSRHAGANHIGIVYKVAGSTVYTIEGNTSGGSSVIDNGGGVAKKSYPVSYSRIMGYARPKYDASTSAKTTTKISTTGYYKKYTGKSDKIDTVFATIGVQEIYRGSWKKRKPVAVKNGYSNYTGTTKQNIALIELAKQGKLKKV